MNNSLFLEPICVSVWIEPSDVAGFELMRRSFLERNGSFKDIDLRMFIELLAKGWVHSSLREAFKVYCTDSKKSEVNEK